MAEIREIACAKINLCLDVTAKREDGYHEIESVMVCVSFGDEVILQSNGGHGVTLSCSDPTLPTDGKNLAVKAANAFLEATGRCDGVHIVLNKKTPDKAGLAGGSADAAAVLRGINVLTGEGLSDAELCRIAESVGSDVVFCVASDPAYVSGRGERLSDAPPLPECAIVLAKGADGVKTPEAYSDLDGLFGDFSSQGGRADRMLSALETGELDSVCESLYNIFESVVAPKIPDIEMLKSKLCSCGAKGALMSGSGSAVFGLFTTLDEAEQAAEQIRADGYWAVACEPI